MGQKKLDVGVLGATGMVGQQFLVELGAHPWFNLILARGERAIRREAVCRGDVVAAPNADASGRR